MLDRDSWYPRAVEGLEAGRQRRTSHDCGEGRTLLASRRLDGSCHAWCFRCNDGDGTPAPRLSLAELARIAERGRQEDAVHAGVLSGPEPRCYALDEWPLDARVWLYRAGFGKPEIERLGAYWHEPTRRVVLPIHAARSSDGRGVPSVQAGDTVYWIARAIDKGRQPKYLACDADRTRVVAESIPQRMGGHATPLPSVVLTEDWLSAAKVGAQHPAVCLLGTSISDGVAAYVARCYRRALVWLDPDDAGRRAATRVRRRLELLGVPCTIINSPKDPKLMTHAEIASVCAAGEPATGVTHVPGL